MSDKQSIAQSFNDEASKSWGALLFSEAPTPEQVQALLDAGADPNWRRDGDKKTPLRDVVRYCENPELVRVLIRAGADVMLTDGYGHIPLEIASSGAMIKALLEKDAALQLAKEHNSSGTILSHAVRFNDADCVRALLEGGANPAGYKNKDFPPLHTALNCRNIDCIDVLLQHSPETQINYIDNRDGYNAAMRMFHAGADYDDKTLIHYCRKLIELGTDLSHEDHDGLTLLDHIRQCPSSVSDPLEIVYHHAWNKHFTIDIVEKTVCPAQKMIPKKKVAP